MKLVITCAIAAAACASFADVTFADSDFTDVGLWAYTPITTVHDVTTVASGGNPDGYVRITMGWPNSTNYETTAFNNSSWHYDPSGGAVTSMDLAADIRPDTAIGRAPILMMLQNNTWYLHEMPNVFSTDWTSRAENGLTANDFFLIDFVNTTVDLNSHPDFSTSGTNMEMGWCNALSPTSEGREILDYDNVNITIHTQAVPEPMTCSVLGLGVLGLMRRRRRA